MMITQGYVGMELTFIPIRLFHSLPSHLSVLDLKLTD